MDYALALWRLVCLAILALVVFPLLRCRRPAGAPPAPKSLAAFSGVVSLGFALVLALQALWALAPEVSSGYRACATLDRRTYRLRSPHDRRALADRAGTPLVVNVTSEAGIVRQHIFGSRIAHLLGYHHARFGQTGAEAACNTELSTARRPAWAILGSLGQPGNPLTSPLRLTLDTAIQCAAAEALNGRIGAVVVLAPTTGEVLALASAPSFDPDSLTQASFRQLRDDARRPLLNRALAGLYPPGSTYKPVTAAALLAQGYGPGTAVTVPPEGYTPPGDSQPIRDHEASEAARTGHAWAGHGRLDMRAAMAMSANGYFAALGNRLGGAALCEAGRAFGIDRPWALTPDGWQTDDLLARPGTLPDPRDRPAVVARAAIGQGRVLVTPLHMALVAAAVANHGQLMPPRLLLEAPAAQPLVVMTAPIADKVAGLMRCAVTDPRGTARGLRMGAIPVAAKTGSAENDKGAPHAWVIGFAPSDRPRLAFAVLVEHGGAGSKAAVPIARAVLEAARRGGWLAAGGTP
ncbi:MAG: penicillin-binding protein 2 [Armatimonadetes bacterium]|nr:penicillin-binding protein 2 [Armatimonadota bacterium]